MTTDTITKAIQGAIQKEIELIVAEESSAAAKRVEEKVRERTGSIAAKVLQRFTLERFGQELRITVNFEGVGEDR